jgi:hypothetical protein
MYEESSMSRIYVTFCFSSFILFGGCTPLSNLDSALKQPVADAKSAADLVALAEQDSLKLIALGVVVPDGSVTLSSRVCRPATGPDVVGSNLATFVDALSAIDKVAAKPADSSYAAILGRIKEDKKAAIKDYEEERKESIKKRDTGRDRCDDLFAADIDPKTHAHILKAGDAGSTVAAASATFAALDKLANSILTAYEQGKRDLALKATVHDLVPQMRTSIASLETARSGGFGLQIVDFPEPSAAARMNGTAFGAAISIHRWWLAKTIQAQWVSLSRCRGAKPTMTCFESEKDQQLVNDLSAAILQYRCLALIDTDAAISSLKKAVDSAEQAGSAKTMAALLDSLSQIGNALSTISSNYTAYQKTRT